MLARLEGGLQRLWKPKPVASVWIQCLKEHHSYPENPQMEPDNWEIPVPPPLREEGASDPMIEWNTRCEQVPVVAAAEPSQLDPCKVIS
ncbi:hypothetical protein AAY473_015020, partial [Plecturocebus cupreus]